MIYCSVDSFFASCHLNATLDAEEVREKSSDFKTRSFKVNTGVWGEKALPKRESCQFCHQITLVKSAPLKDITVYVKGGILEPPILNDWRLGSKGRRTQQIGQAKSFQLGQPQCFW